MNKKRRKLLLALAALGTPAASWALPTPRQTAGPFYPVKLPLDDDSDLTQVKGRDTRAQGQITDLSGRILDLNGKPQAGLRIEIWQCDIYGRYHHPRDRGRQLDESFQGHGATTTDADGRYGFRTIRPVPYPMRTPHIHVAVFEPGQPRFTTQLYVAGDPRNQDDFLYRRIPTTQRPMVSAVFSDSPSPDADLRAEFDLVLGSEGTPSA